MKVKFILLLFLFVFSTQKFLRRIEEDVIYENAPKLNDENQAQNENENTVKPFPTKNFEINEIEIRYKDKPLNIKPKILKNEP
jgi:hypothetical protein